MSGTSFYSQITKKISSEWMNFSCRLRCRCWHTTGSLSFILLLPRGLLAVESLHGSLSSSHMSMECMQTSHVWALFVLEIDCLEKPWMLQPLICVWITSTQTKASDICLMFSAAKSCFFVVFAAFVSVKTVAAFIFYSVRCIYDNVFVPFVDEGVYFGVFTVRKIYLESLNIF